MKLKITKWFILLICFSTVSVNAQTDTAVVLTIQGDLPKPVTFTATQIDAMNKIELNAADMSRQQHVYTGVAVTDILKAAGVINSQSHRDNLTKYVLVRSSDNYEVLFSMTELDSAFSGRTILLVDKVDGKPLPPGKGPYRIAVPGEEKRQARWIWGVTTFIIRITKD